MAKVNDAEISDIGLQRVGASLRHQHQRPVCKCVYNTARQQGQAVFALLHELRRAQDGYLEPRFIYLCLSVCFIKAALSITIFAATHRDIM